MKQWVVPRDCTLEAAPTQGSSSDLCIGFIQLRGWRAKNELFRPGKQESAQWRSGAEKFPLQRRIFFRPGGNKRMKAQAPYNSGEVHSDI
jgi:hypothetical protein